MFVSVANDWKPNKLCFLPHLPKIFRLSKGHRNYVAPLGELKADRKEEKFKTSENCFQMHLQRSEQFLTFFPTVSFFPQFLSLYLFVALM